MKNELQGALERIQARGRKFGRRNCTATDRLCGGGVLRVELLLLSEPFSAQLLLSLKEKVYEHAWINEPLQQCPVSPIFREELGELLTNILLYMSKSWQIYPVWYPGVKQRSFGRESTWGLVNFFFLCYIIMIGEINTKY